MKILVTGATGRVGSELVKLLSDHDVVGVSTSTDPRFDWNDSSNWDELLTNIDVVFLMAPDGQQFVKSFFDIAWINGVRKIVMLSSQAIEEMKDKRLLDGERMLKESGISYAIVRSDWMLENFLTFFKPMIMSGTFSFPGGDYVQGFIGTKDVANFTAHIINSDLCGTFEISGPPILSFRDMVKRISFISHRGIEFVEGTEEDYKNSLIASGVAETDATAKAHDFVSGLHQRADAGEAAYCQFFAVVKNEPTSIADFLWLNKQAWMD